MTDGTPASGPRAPRGGAVRRAAGRGYKSAALALRRLASPLRVLPDFLVLGAQKGGTSSLFEYLVAHPGVRAPFRKEVHYFDVNHDRGVQWYRSFFPLRSAASERWLTGDATPYYLFHPQAPCRAAALVPDARLIVLLRNPVERAYSQYQHSCRKGFETRSFEQAIEEELLLVGAEARRLEEDPRYRSEMHQHRAYVTRGQYVEQLERWARWYPRSRFLVLTSEQLFREPAMAYAEVLRFLDLPPFRPAAFGTHNRHPHAAKLNPGTRAALDAHYAPWNQRLSEWLGWTPEW
jgi:hypothetical protein